MNLDSLQKILQENKIPFVSYRLPREKDIVTLVQSNGLPQEIDIENFDFSKAGFIVSPFCVSEQYKSYFLSPDYIFYNNDIPDEFLQKTSETRQFIDREENKTTDIKTTLVDEYCANVRCAISEIKNGVLNKVMLSKVRVENLPDCFKPESFFASLCETYTDAMVYFLQIPNVGCWIGATPEPLLVFEDEKIKTVSLAGTQKATGKAIDEYTWTEKEIDEQAVVTDFIERTLKNAGVEKYEKTVTSNCQAGNLIHLKTEFQFAKSVFFRRFHRLLLALHPTPSVGGMPQNKALNFILENEQHQRAYFSGFLGAININEKTGVYVNLRCLQLLENSAVFYAGAGITISSEAEAEWEETENKIETLTNCF